MDFNALIRRNPSQSPFSQREKYQAPSSFAKRGEGRFSVSGQGTTHYSLLTTHKNTLARRITLYSAALLIASVLIVWSTGKVQAINAESALALNAASSSSQQSLVEALKSSQLSGFDLAERGLGLLKLGDRTADPSRLARAEADASLYLQAAALKDPLYRDAALYAGAAELALADSAWDGAQAVAISHTKVARQFLEQARAIDPIYAETFRLLDIAYTNLGQTQLAADAQHKATLFASVGKES